jgi:hypothetical protein
VVDERRRDIGSIDTSERIGEGLHARRALGLVE